jgi:hypothetical protein
MKTYGGVNVQNNVFFTSVLGAASRPGRVTPRERAHCIGGWVGHRTDLDEVEKILPYRDSNSDPSAA